MRSREGGGSWGNHGFPHDYRGAQIRTGDLSDPNGARYQAAPHPEPRKGSDSAARRLGRLARRDEIVALCGRAARDRPVPRVRPAGPPGRRRRRGDDDRLRGLVVAGALRARGGPGCGAGARPSRALLAQRAARRRLPAARPPGGALRRATRRSSRTTWRSTHTRRSATTRSWPRGSARRPTAPSAASGSACSLPPVAVDELAGRVEEAVGRAPLVLRGGDGDVRRLAVSTGAAGYSPDPGGARGLRRAPHRRARGAQPGDRSGARDPPDRRRAPRDRAARRPGARGRAGERFGLVWEYVEVENPV